MDRLSRQSRGSRSMERRSRSYKTRDSESPFPRLSLSQLRIKSEPYEDIFEPLMITVEERDVKTHESVIAPVGKVADETKVNHEPDHGAPDASYAERVTEVINVDRGNRTVREWDEVKPHVERFYLTENRSLRETRLLMIERFGFDASLYMYRKKVKAWRWQKVGPKQTSTIANAIAEIEPCTSEVAMSGHEIIERPFRAQIIWNLQSPSQKATRASLLRESEAYFEFFRKYLSLHTNIHALSFHLRLVSSTSGLSELPPRVDATRYSEIQPWNTIAMETLRKIEEDMIVDHFPVKNMLPLRDLRWFFLKLVKTVYSILSYISAPQNFTFEYDRLIHEAYLVGLWNDVGKLMDSVLGRKSGIHSYIALGEDVWDWSARYQIDVPHSLRQYGLPAQLILPGVDHDASA